MDIIKRLETEIRLKDVEVRKLEAQLRWWREGIKLYGPDLEDGFQLLGETYQVVNQARGNT